MEAGREPRVRGEVAVYCVRTDAPNSRRNGVVGLWRRFTQKSATSVDDSRIEGELTSPYREITLRLTVLVLVATLYSTAAPAIESVPKAVIADLPPDAKFPARMEVIHVPSGGVQINGVVYIASGERPHPAFVFFHGLPGNEKNLDLAQAVRRAGWTVVTVNYRGSWGSPGNFRFAQNLEDAQATLSFIRSPENVKRLAIDPTRVAIGGHSMGGWVTAETLAHDLNLLGAVIISAGDFGAIGLRAQQNRQAVIADMNDNRESLAGVTGESMADEVKEHGKDWSFRTLAPELIHRNLLVLYSNDFVKADSLELIKDVKDAGGTTITEKYVVTDHSWSDHRIALESLVINWLETLSSPR
jgi:acetyl esterase/lipase